MTDTIELTIDRPVAGGRMLARSDRGVVLVSGAIPGERVRVEIERTTRQVAWARTVEVIEPSADRRDPPCDPACGGLAYAHIRYQRQCELKGEVVADAFRRIGRMVLDAPVPVAASPERGYRLRARLHVRERRVGFFREHSHDLCDADRTGQLGDGAIDAVEGLLASLGSSASACGSLVIAENVPATERVVHLEPLDGREFDGLTLPEGLPPGVTGVTAWGDGKVRMRAGEGRVCDTAAALFEAGLPAGIPADTAWCRGAASFFQGNRFLLGTLLETVLGHVVGDRLGDVYAGVGLFAVAAAASGREVLAIEADRHGAADLRFNARRWPRLAVERASAERLLPQVQPGVFDTLVLDPPRSGLSPEAMDAVVRLAAGRVVYVSCDVATLARDTARLRDAGYRLATVTGLDLFPNTGHVEVVAVFDRG